MVGRIHIGTDYVAVSKPGIDVESAASSYDNMALDSRLSNLRPLQIAVVPGYVFGNKVFYGQTFSQPPAVDIFFWNDFVLSGQTYAGVVRYGVYNDGNDYQRSSYFIVHETNGFTITARTSSANAPCFTGSWQLFYTAWKIR